MGLFWSNRKQFHPNTQRSGGYVSCLKGAAGDRLRTKLGCSPFPSDPWKRQVEAGRRK